MTNDFTNEHRYISVSISGVGGSSIIMVFAVLCLTVFAVLTLMTAKTEFDTSQRLNESIKNYYRADHKASEFVAALQSADNIIEIQVIANKNGAVCEAMTDTDSGIFLFVDYSVPIDESQDLSIRLEITPGSNTEVCINIVKWISVYTDEWSSETSLNLLKQN